MSKAGATFRVIQTGKSGQNVQVIHQESGLHVPVTRVEIDIDVNGAAILKLTMFGVDADIEMTADDSYQVPYQQR